MTPRLQKIETIKWMANRFAIEVFVETGTFQGDMLDSLKSTFRQLHSIELDPKLHASARNRFFFIQHIRLWVGDSAEMLPKVAKAIRTPALFWLDAHSMFGETYAGNPLLKELTAILSNHGAPHAVLIDDINLFGTGDFPAARDVYGAIDEMNIDVRGDILIACSPDLVEIERVYA